MQLTNRSKVASVKTLNWHEKLYLPAIVKGMIITFSHIFRKKATIRYPEQKRPIAAVYRGVHVLKRDDQGRENCTACGLCAVACPAEAITMEAAERQKGEEHLYREEKYAAMYEINMLRCIFCGLCEEACPKDAIYLTRNISEGESFEIFNMYGVLQKRIYTAGNVIDVSDLAPGTYLIRSEKSGNNKFMKF